MEFEILGDITDIETIAVGKAIRELPRLRATIWDRALEKAEGGRNDSVVGREDQASRVTLVRGTWDRTQGVQAETLSGLKHEKIQAVGAGFCRMY